MTSTTSIVKDKKEHDWGIGSFFIGLFLIPFSLVWIWKNEKKIVRFHEVIVNAEKSIKKDVPIAEIDDAKEFDLVHMKGTTNNKEPLKDEDVDYSVDNCYRVTRTVEMYQTKETKTEKRRDDDHVEITYSYEDGWFADHHDSSNYNDHSRANNNPKNTWPFKSSNKEAENVNLGAYFLAKTQVSSVGLKNVKTEDWKDQELNKFAKVSE